MSFFINKNTTLKKLSAKTSKNPLTEKVRLIGIERQTRYDFVAILHAIGADAHVAVEHHVFVQKENDAADDVEYRDDPRGFRYVRHDFLLD